MKDKTITVDELREKIKELPEGAELTVFFEEERNDTEDEGDKI